MVSRAFRDSLRGVCVRARCVPASQQNAPVTCAESNRAYLFVASVAYRMFLDWHTENAGARDPDSACDDHQPYEDDHYVDCQP